MDILKRHIWGQPPSAVQRAQLAKRERPESQERVPHFSRAFCARSGEVSHAHSIKIASKLVILVSLISLTGCSPRDYLTRRLATDLIATSEAFNSPQQYILRTGVMANKDYVSPEYVVLLHKGWISATNVACPKDVAPPPCWDVLLTASGVDTVRAVARESDDDKSFTIPVAKRELISVSGISKQGGSAVVEFTWKWAPVNEVGAALYSTDQRFRSSVGFRQYDDGWRIVPGLPRPVQPMDDALKNAEPVS